MEADPPFYLGQYRTTAPRAYRLSAAEGRLTDDDRRLIEEFLFERQATRHISISRVVKLRYSLIAWRRFIHTPCAGMTLADLYASLKRPSTSLSTVVAIRGSARGVVSVSALHDVFSPIKDIL